MTVAPLSLAKTRKLIHLILGNVDTMETNPSSSSRSFVLPTCGSHGCRGDHGRARPQDRVSCIVVSPDASALTLRLSPPSGENILACGLANGSIKLVKVSQKLEQLTSLSPFGCNSRIQCDFVPLDVQPARPDGKGITALTWIEAYTVCQLLH